MRDQVFHCCWSVLGQVGWQKFSWNQVLQDHPGLSQAEILQYFATPKDLLWYFLDRVNHRIPLYQGLTPKDHFFELIASRLEALAPHRAILLDIALHLGPCDRVHVAHQIHQAFFPRIQASAKVPKMCAWLAVGVYGLAFHHTLSHTQEETMIQLDQWLSTLMPWLAPAFQGFP